jgi:hypothetical protein
LPLAYSTLSDTITTGFGITPLLSQPELLPLAVLAKSEQPEMLLSQVAEKVNAIENQRQKAILPLVWNF